MNTAVFGAERRRSMALRRTPVSQAFEKCFQEEFLWAYILILVTAGLRGS